MNKITFFLFFFCVTLVSAQNSWKKIDSKSYGAKTELEFRKSTPNKFDLYSLDTENLKNTLSTQKTISIPNISGGLSKFYIKEHNSFTNEVAPKYGYIKSFSLSGIDDKTATGKMSIGTDGVHVIIFSGNQATTFIDPYTKDKSTYITYGKDQIPNTEENFTCLTEKEETLVRKINASIASKNANDGILRNYRLALACTGEYADFHIDNQGVNLGTEDEKRAAVLSAMNTTMTRVNGIFEKDLAANMSIILNSDGENELIFLDSETDNLTNNNGVTLIEESQDICDDIIGNANYDIGHTFSTGGGGYASLGSLCVEGEKGRGITGQETPVGDAFDINFVAHEIGHQFGADHTFNNFCGENNRVDAFAVEPGSGTTIMSYAGICSPDIQDNSDDYFHSVSIDQMWVVVQSTSCASETITNNVAPVVNAGNDVFVPKSTPLILKGEATDEDDSSLTYTWEQIDNEIATMPPLSTNIAGPAFRSLSPNSSSNRYLPSLNTVISGSTETEWEVLPSVAREMNFSLLVRDNNPNGGATARDDMNITVIDVDPFTVITPNTAVTWNVGSTETILWDKSTTDEAPINSANVKISLSTDGGETFPITLVESTPNDGSHDIIVPNQLTSTARIMVESVDNIFYNVNTINFTIDATGPTFVLSNASDDQEVCNEADSSVSYDINVSFLNDFSESVTLSTDNIPSGVTAALSTTTLTENDKVTLTLSNFENTSAGSYSIIINGNAASLSSILELPTLVVTTNNFESVILSTPENNTEDLNPQNTQLTWEDSENASSYDLELAIDSEFNTVIISQEDIENNSYTLSEILDWSTTYYWRVKPTNDCGSGDFSSTFNFTTTSEEYCSSSFTQTINSEFITNVTFGSIDNDSGDANDSEEEGTAGYQDFTDISTTLLIGIPYVLSVTLDPIGYQDHCYVFIDWNSDSIFDLETERYDLGDHTGNISTATQEIIVPDDATLGATRMRVIIEYFDENISYGLGPCDTDHNSEYGETEDYTLIIAKNSFNNDNVFENFLMFPNPVDETLNLLFDVPYTDEYTNFKLYDFSGKLIRTLNYINYLDVFNESIDLSGVSSGVYLLKITNGIKYTTKKIIIK